MVDYTIKLPLSRHAVKIDQALNSVLRNIAWRKFFTTVMVIAAQPLKFHVHCSIQNWFIFWHILYNQMIPEFNFLNQWLVCLKVLIPTTSVHFSLYSYIFQVDHLNLYHFVHPGVPLKSDFSAVHYVNKLLADPRVIIWTFFPKLGTRIDIDLIVIKENNWWIFNKNSNTSFRQKNLFSISESISN